MKIIFLLLVLLFTSGCAITEKRWKVATSEDTVSSYETFLKRYPNSEFTNKALIRLEQLYDKKDWEETQSVDTIEAYKGFLRIHSNSEFVTKARNRLEHLIAQLDWNTASSADTITAYSNFLKDHGNSQFADQAQKRLEQLELLALNTAWKEAQSLNTIEAYEMFSRKYPETEFTAQASERLEELGENLQEIIITRKHINKIKRGERKYIFPIVTIQITSEAPYIIVKDSNGKYNKITPTGSENFTGGIDIPKLRYMKPYEGIALFISLHDLAGGETSKIFGKLITGISKSLNTKIGDVTLMSLNYQKPWSEINKGKKKMTMRILVLLFC